MNYMKYVITIAVFLGPILLGLLVPTAGHQIFPGFHPAIYSPLENLLGPTLWMSLIIITVYLIIFFTHIKAKYADLLLEIRPIYFAGPAAGFFLFSLFSIEFLNKYLDHQPAIEEMGTLIEAVERKQKMPSFGKTKYSVHSVEMRRKKAKIDISYSVSVMRGQGGEVLKFQINEGLHSRILSFGKPGKSLIKFKVKRGYFGAPWIESADLVEEQESDK